MADQSMLLALAEEDLSKIELELQRGFDPNRLFGFVVSTKNLSLIELFLQYGAQPKATDILYAIHEANLELLQILLGSGIDPNDYWKPAILRGNLEVIETLLWYGIKVQNDAKTLFHAIETKNYPLLDLLFRYGADPDLYLKCVTVSGNLEMTRFLIEHGGNVNWKNGCLFNRARLQMVQLLLKLGADPTVNGYKPVLSAYNKYRQDIDNLQFDSNPEDSYQIVEAFFNHPKVVIHFHEDLRFRGIVDRKLNQLGIGTLNLDWNSNLQMQALTQAMKKL